jgi:hypothetical protein
MKTHDTDESTAVGKTASLADVLPKIVVVDLLQAEEDEGEGHTGHEQIERGQELHGRQGVAGAPLPLVRPAQPHQPEPRQPLYVPFRIKKKKERKENYVENFFSQSLGRMVLFRMSIGEQDGPLSRYSSNCLLNMLKYLVPFGKATP